MVSALVDLCLDLDVRCVVQVGAEDGYEAHAIMRDTGCRAIAIDPDPKCGPMGPGLEFHEVLIGGSQSTMPFFLHPGTGLSGQYARHDGPEIALTLPQHRLDRFCITHRIVPDALIIDTEGTTLDVLEGAGDLLGAVKLIYAEVQVQDDREGVRLLPEVDTYLSARGFVQRPGLPSYDVGAQGNYTWVRP